MDKGNHSSSKCSEGLSIASSEVSQCSVYFPYDLKDSVCLDCDADNRVKFTNLQMNTDYFFKDQTDTGNSINSKCLERVNMTCAEGIHKSGHVLHDLKEDVFFFILGMIMERS